MVSSDLERDLLRHGSSLQALARSLLGRGADAEDAVQETLMLALSQPPRGAGPLGGWLHTVLESVAAKLRRGRARRRLREERAAMPEAQPGADALAMRRETLHAVMDAVFALPEPYRAVIWSRFFEGQLPGAIAARTGEPLATVKSRLQRALGLLRERLDARGPGDWRGTLVGAFGLEPAAGAAVALGYGVIMMSTGTKIAWACAAAVVVTLGIVVRNHLGTDAGSAASPHVAAPAPEVASQPAALPTDHKLRAPIGAAPEGQSDGQPSQLRVVVLTHTGTPVPGIRVLAEDADAGPEQARVRVLGKTDGRGEVVTPLDHAVKPPAHRVRLTAQFPGAESVVVAWDAAPRAPVELRLPPTGSVTVQVLDATGEPFDPRYLDPPVLVLGAYERKPADRQTESDGMHRFPLDAVIDERGLARFPAVALDRHVVVRLGYFDALSLAGPTSAIPHVEDTLRLDPGNAVCVARVLGPDQAPLASRRFWIAYRCGGGSGLFECRSDDAGRIRCSLGAHPVGKQAVLTVDTNPFPPADQLAIELPSRALHAGDNDLGDVVTARHHVLVAGRIVTERGTETLRPALQLERWREDRWEQERNLYPEFRRADRFVMRGSIPVGERLRLVFSPGAHLPLEPIEFLVGTTDVVVRLRAAPLVKAVFLVDEGMPPQGIGARLERTHPPAEPRPDRGMLDLLEMKLRQDADGRLSRTWTGLTPGTYRLSVQCPGCSEPVLTLDGLAVDSGPCADPRLAGIDLRGRVQRMQVRANDADGLPVADERCFVVVRSKGRDWRGFSLRRGVVELVASSAVDLLLVAPGHQVEEVNGVREDRTVALRRAPRVRIVVELPAVLPEGVAAALRLTPQLGFPSEAIISLDTGRGMTLDDFLTEAVPCGPDGGQLAVRWTGRYATAATLTHRGKIGHFILDDSIEPREVLLDASKPDLGVTIKVLQPGFERTLQGMAR